ncbi:MAG: ABC transporter permease [Filifactoraceae bacterium]
MNSQTVKNYINLYKSTFKINIKSLMIYDIDFIVGVIAMVIKSGINFSIILILFNLITNISGWNFNEMLFLYGFSTVAFAIWHCFFIDTITIPTYIKTGEFDRFLTKPYNPLFLIIIEAFDDDGWGELILGLIINIIAIIRLKLYTPLLLLLPILWMAAALVYAGISILLSTISFFTIDNMDITDLTMQLNEFSKYPLTIYDFTLKTIFTIILPIGFTAYYPSLIFIRNISLTNISLMILAILFSITFFLISCKIWMLCLKKYTSSGF